MAEVLAHCRYLNQTTIAGLGTQERSGRGALYLTLICLERFAGDLTLVCSSDVPALGAKAVVVLVQVQRSVFKVSDALSPEAPLASCATLAVSGHHRPCSCAQLANDGAVLTALPLSCFF